ncbi:AfsR/SARP family transcriptional regulator [Thermoactinospora rubra]|uniref:AfsR/SARP family transcriptional regulator n=1 Tax=Thermoactinospora rubra TaxID=1088767 RepID=UPI001F0AF8FA|nr:BTAD domain-containing putative transcriptional regulator [Thermoactinospora rubra]
MSLLFGLVVAGGTFMLLRTVRFQPRTAPCPSRPVAPPPAPLRDDTSLMRSSGGTAVVSPTPRRPEPAEAPTSPATEQQAGPAQVRATVAAKPAPPLQIRLLGEVVIDGPTGLIDCASGKDLPDLLGQLAVHRHGVARERVYEVLWPDVPLDKYDVFHSPKKEIARRLEKALGWEEIGATELIQQASQRYWLNKQLITVDYWQLTDLLDQAGKVEDAPEQVALLRQAVRLYRGPFLPASTREWSEPIREDLRKRVVKALTTLTDHETDPEELVELLDRALRLDPCNEPLRCRQMRTYADLGRTDAVHRSYQDLKAALADLGDLRPRARTTEVYLQLTGRR